MYGTVGGHSNFGRGAGDRDYKIAANKMKLVLLPGLVEVDGDVVAIVHMLLDVTVHLGSNIWRVDVESSNPLGGTIVVFTQLTQVLSVQALHRHFVVDLVHKGIVHDIQDPFLLGDWGKFLMS